MRRELHVQRLVFRLKHRLPVNKMLDLQLQSHNHESNNHECNNSQCCTGSCSRYCEHT